MKDKTLIVLHVVFWVSVVLWIIVAGYAASQFISHRNALESCNGVPDAEFKQCYQEKL